MRSGDQAINAILKGAKSITLFDSNALTEEYFYLKLAAIKALSLEEFKRFFCYRDYNIDFKSDNENAMDIKLYLKISPFLNKKAKLFWDILYYESEENFRNSHDMYLFNQDEYSVRHYNYFNDYFNEEDYNKLKFMIDKVKIDFVSIDIKAVPGKFQNQKFDYIFLSNIIQYVNRIYDKNFLQKFKKLIVEMKNLLRDNG